MNVDEKYLLLKKRLKITDKDIASDFGYKNAASFSKSARRQQVIEGVVRMYERANGEIQ